MKKIFLIILLPIILLSGCTQPNRENANNISNPKADIPIICSPENPPQTYQQRTPGYEYNALDLCGIKTTYSAVELKEYDLILFADSDFIMYDAPEFNDKKIKIISTVAPFNIEHIGIVPNEYPIFEHGLDNNPDQYTKDGWYIWGGAYGELCGASYYLFAFSPTTKEFISGGNNDNCGSHPLKFISSSGKFSAKDIGLVSGFDNEKQDNIYTFEELCGPLDISNLDRFTDGFPDKIYCYKGFWLPNKEQLKNPVGYFDLMNDKFVYSNQ